MADHREAHTHRESQGDREFSFWNSSNTTIPSNIDCDQIAGRGNEASFNREESVFGEKIKRKNSKLEYSPFLPRSHRCSSASDPSRSKAVEEGRKELMEMMQGMPESNFELSFQDMVFDEKQKRQDDTSEEKTLKSSSSNNKALTKKPNDKKKSKCNRPNQISRVESMDSETFLLKMFIPTTLKKVKVENGSKVSPRPSLLESSKYLRVKGFFQAKDNKGHQEHSISKNTRTNHDKSRHFGSNISFSQGCWPFLHYTTKRLGG